MSIPGKFARDALDLLPYGDGFDSLYAFLLFLRAHGRIPRRKSGLFNDYLFFRKISPSLMDILRQITSDKIMLKDFARTAFEDGRVARTLAVFTDLDEISPEDLSYPCVIKPSHGNGSVVFARRAEDLREEATLARLHQALAESPYTRARERNYRFLQRRLICEEMLPEAERIKDYKFFCYNGEPRIVQVDSERHTFHRRNLYTTSWEPLDMEYNFPPADIEERPAVLDEMLEGARALSAPFDFVRVDFLLSGAGPVISELTHVPEAAHGRFRTLTEERRFSQHLFGPTRA